MQQETCSLLGAQHHQITGRRTGTHLKRWHCAIPASSFVARRTRVAISLYAALSREAKVIVSELIGYIAANVDSSYERKLGELHWWSVFIHFWRTDLTICLFFRALVMERRWGPACLLGWHSATHWYHIRMTVDWCQSVLQSISRNDNPHFRKAKVLSLLNSQTFWCAFLLIRDATRYSEQTSTLQSAFWIKNP